MGQTGRDEVKPVDVELLESLPGREPIRRVVYRRFEDHVKRKKFGKNIYKREQEERAAAEHLMVCAV
jgi:hypothetical protein